MSELPLLALARPHVEPWTAEGGVRLFLGSCLDVLRSLPADSVDAGVTDPPYGIGFMGKEWDTFAPDTIESRGRKAFKVGHGYKNHENPNIRGRSHSPARSPSQVEYDRSIEGQRGFQAWCQEWATEVYRVLKPGAHLLVCGAPRSAHRMISGVEDAGFEIRDGIAWLFGQGFPKSYNLDGEFDGWGTALKPGHEPICVARKPFRGTVEANMRAHGVGAINIDACRLDGIGDGASVGRWPPNVALDEQAARALDEQAGPRTSGANPTRRSADRLGRNTYGTFKGDAECTPARGAETGGASRFFFCPKPSRAERDRGCDALPHRTPGECTDRTEGSAGITPYAGAGRSGGGRNFHPTVKPVALMRWLIDLVTPAGGVVLDPFLGSGTTGIAAVQGGYRFIGIDREQTYLELAAARIGVEVPR